MPGSRHQCLQPVPYLQRELVHEQAGRAPSHQEERFLWGIGRNNTSPLLLFFSALSTDTLKIEAKRTLSSAFIHCRQNSVCSPLKPEHNTSQLQSFKARQEVSAAFQGHESDHKQKSTLPPNPNPPFSKSNPAVLQASIHHSSSKPSFRTQDHGPKLLDVSWVLPASHSV